jgi:hypothetical protein
MLLHTGASVLRFQEINYKSYTLLLYSFAKHIEWPYEQSKQAFVFGVYGQSPVYNELLEMARTKKVRGLAIKVKKISSPAEAVSCDIIFLPNNKCSEVKAINPLIENQGVLLVCERSGYCLKGGAISFAVDDDGALRFDINTKVCQSQKLKVNSQLIQIADRVYQ